MFIVAVNVRGGGWGGGLKFLTRCFGKSINLYLSSCMLGGRSGNAHRLRTAL